MAWSCQVLRFAVMSLIVVTASAKSPTSRKLDGPVPLELAVGGVKGLDYYSTPQMSPDGAWVAFAQAVGDTVAYNGKLVYSATGVPQIYGRRTQVTLLNTKSNRLIRVGGSTAWSWGPAWSLRGERLAYYSDEGGKTRIWIWDQRTGHSAPLPPIARPYSRSDPLRWSSDSKHILCKLLPLKLTLSEANAPDQESIPANPLQPPIQFREAGPNEPAVFVYETHHDAPMTDQSSTADSHPDVRSATADLVVLNVQTAQVTRIDEAGQARWYDFSPDGRYIAFSTFTGYDANDWYGRQDLNLYDTVTKERKTLAANLSLYGDSCNWSPNGLKLACVLYNIKGHDHSSMRSELTVFSTDGSERRIASNLKVLSGYPNAVLWNENSGSVYVIGTDETPSKEPMWYSLKHDRLWTAALDGSDARVLSDVQGHQIAALISSDGRVPWTPEGTGWMFTRTLGKHIGSAVRSYLYRIDLVTGRAERHLAVNTGWWGQTSVASATHAILYTATTLQSPQDLWLFNVDTKQVHQISQLNSTWDRYELGHGMVLNYQDVEGRPLRGGLLLPPGYKHDRKLPLIVFVFGYGTDSEAINSFGIFGGNAASYNMHVLATRGFAVLHPDLPLRQGTQMKDVLNSAIPGVNAAIAQGYVDPDRMGIMGYSIGSFSALALALQSDRFKAVTIGGIDVVPDLYSSYLYADPLSGNPNSYDEDSYGLAMGGNPWDYRDRFIDNSLAVYFDRLHTALLMGQGTSDGLFISNVIYGGLKRLHKEVEYRVYENEDHSISGISNALDFWKRRLDFYDEHLDIARDPAGRMLFDGDKARSRLRPGKEIAFQEQAPTAKPHVSLAAEGS
jgi:dipeptidyl aminopeptidase/acylaminoacyl peptidase